MPFYKIEHIKNKKANVNLSDFTAVLICLCDHTFGGVVVRVARFRKSVAVFRNIGCRNENFCTCSNDILPGNHI